MVMIERINPPFPTINPTDDGIHTQQFILRKQLEVASPVGGNQPRLGKLCIDVMSCSSAFAKTPQ